MSGECFFVPGSTAHSWNRVTPSTHILVRNDCLEKVGYTSSRLPSYTARTRKAVWKA